MSAAPPWEPDDGLSEEMRALIDGYVSALRAGGIRPGAGH
jgi:hypothetical protein